MPLIIDPKYNDSLQKLVLVSQKTANLTFEIIGMIDNQAIENPEATTVALLKGSFELIDASSNSIDSFIAILLDLERLRALTHDEAQALTYLTLDLGRSCSSPQ